jgi:hypothetical protein
MPTPETETPVRANAFGCLTVPLLLIAMIPLAWGARSNWENGRLAREGIVVPGRVIELRHVPGNPSISGVRWRGQATGSSASPVVTFMTRAGEARTAIGSVNRKPAPWTVGQTVDVAYDPANPSRADVVSELTNWRFWFVIWCMVALLPAAIAFAPVFLLIRQRRRSAVKS